MDRKKVFLVENQGKTVLFAPLKGIVLEVYDSEKSKVAELIKDPEFSLDDLLRLFPEIDKNRLLSLKIKAESQKEIEKFCPTSVVLFTTFDCQLRCIYCYSKAGEKKERMTWKIAKATLDFIINNAKQNGERECFLEFHGGGEPTFNWSIFQSSLIYFQEQAQVNELAVKVSLVTNGILSRKQINWIVKYNVRTVQVSLDGMEEIHNAQRPIVGGGKSFAIVYNTIKSFLAKGVEVMIHSVVTEKGVNRIPEIIHFFGSNFPGTMVQIEPASPCGRGLTKGQQFPSPELFVKGFIEAQDIAKSFGIELVYSGTTNSQLIGLCSSFCGVSEPNFVLTPTGLVTACHEVAELNHPLAEFFIYGQLNYTTSKFIFDYQKIEKLRNSVVETEPKCLECFANFYCAGDCLARRLSDEGEKTFSSSGHRCKINRELTKYYIFNYLFGSKKKGGVP